MPEDITQMQVTDNSTQETTGGVPQLQDQVKNGGESFSSGEVDDGLDASLEKLYSMESEKKESSDKTLKNETDAQFKKEDSKESKQEIQSQDKKQDSKVKDFSGKIIDPATIEDPKLSDRGAQAWKNLKTMSSEIYKVHQKTMRENESLKATVAKKTEETQKQIEELNKQIQELGGYRAMVDVHADPEFLEKFDTPINKIETEIKGMLQKFGVKEETIKQIDFTDSSLLAQIETDIEEKRDKISSKRFARRVEELIELTDKRDEHLQDWKKNSKEFLEKKKGESFAKKTESEGRMIKRIEEIQNGKRENGDPLVPFLAKLSPEEGATKAEQDRIAMHNKVVDGMNDELKKIISLDTPEDRVEIATAALSAKWLKWQLNAASKKISSLEESLKKISTVTSEGETRTRSSTPKTNPTGSDPRSLDLDSSMDSFFGRSS